jgi:methionine synthase II (cobalamin-independent)
MREADAVKVGPEVLIEDLVRECPEAVRVLRAFGIRCIQCGEPIWGTLAEAAREKGIEDLTPVLEALGVCEEQGSGG